MMGYAIHYKKFRTRMAQRLRVDNRTTWDTRDLRRLFGKCVAEAGMETARTVRVVYAKGVYPSGYAYVGSRWLQMALPEHKMVCGEDGKWEATGLV